MIIVRTVLGDVDASELGVVLPHEHVLADSRRFFTEPDDPAESAFAHGNITIETLSWVRYHQRECLQNLVLDDVGQQIEELRHFKRAGGGTIVELTPQCVGRDTGGLRRISEATGLHVVAAAGIYLDQFQTPEVKAMPKEQIAEMLTREVSDGISEGAGDHPFGPVRAGIIGEMGCTWPLTPSETKAMRGAAIAQQRSGASISFHPGRHPDSPVTVLRLLESEGARLDRVVVSHLDRTVPEHAALVELGRTGCYMEFDLFGQESSYIRYGPVDLPNDATRIHRIAALLEAGFEDQILLSLDIATKLWLVAYGGHGYAHILERVVPRMKEVGITDEVLTKMLVKNPAKMLALVQP